KKFNGNKDEAFKAVIDMTKKLTDNNNLEYNVEIYESSKDTGYTNLAIMYTMQKNRVIPGIVDVKDVLEIYNKACTIMIDTRDLAYMGSVLARDGVNLKGEKILSKKNSRILRTLMAICGTYDYSGDFAVDIGIPAKSGVGGGILATIKNGMSIATYCPGLDSKGNSLVGIKY
ncbi:thermolabile glutaminase, partial [Peptoniphilus indolicus ATCC 29427]